MQTATLAKFNEPLKMTLDFSKANCKKTLDFSKANYKKTLDFLKVYSYLCTLTVSKFRKMRRNIIDKLKKWKINTNHKPLIIRGARQVGKSYTIMNFGEENFTGNVHLINFEKKPELHSIFEQNFDVKRILTELELALNKPIIPKKDLLFFDEIQACPKAIISLRYFYEDMQELHVIAAGSLLEFALQDIYFPFGDLEYFRCTQ